MRQAAVRRQPTGGHQSRDQHGEQLHVTERYTRTDSNTLKLEATIEDPEYYTKPWTVVTQATWYPNQEILEYICQENNRDLKHLVGTVSK